ncbi:MAG: hypothetical protein R3F54_06080 [Alphaproteobacteria bacterium]
MPDAPIAIDRRLSVVRPSGLTADAFVGVTVLAYLDDLVKHGKEQALGVEMC